MNRSMILAALMCCSMTVGAMAQDHSKPATPAAPKTAQPGDVKKDMKDAAPAIPGMNSAEMDAMMKAGMPGPMHAWMSKMEGSWDAACKMWMSPDAPAVESKGTMTTTMMFGKYAHSMFKGDMMGQPFEGVACMGYNNVTDQFESTWVDSMSTGTMMSKGTLSADKKTLTMNSECVDPMTKKPCAGREVTTMMGDDKYKMEMFSTKDGKEWKCMEIMYTKSKGATKEKDAMDKMKMEADKKAKEMEDKMKKNLPASK